ECLSRHHSISGTTERGLSRYSYRRGAPLPLALAFAGHTGIRARSPDPGISIAHARRPTVVVSLCAHTLQKSGLIQLQSCFRFARSPMCFGGSCKTVGRVKL